MAHYATLDENNIVTHVCVGRDETDPTEPDWEVYYKAKRTSYNTRGGIYYDPATGEPAADQSKAFRKNYAGIGFTFDEQRDAFIPPKPFASWLLNEQSCLWDPPVPYPTDDKRYEWDETTQSWKEI